MGIHFNPTSSSQGTTSLPGDELSLFIPIAFATITAVGLIGTIRHCFGTRVWTQSETSKPKNETTEKPSPTPQPLVDEERPSPESDGEPPLASKEAVRERKAERNRLRNEKRRQKKKDQSSSTGSDNSDTLARSSSERSTSDGGSSSSASSSRQPVLPGQFIFTSPSEASSEETSPREPEPLYVADRYIAMNVPQDQFDAFYRQATDLLDGGQRSFNRSTNPHITIADAEDTRHLTSKDKKKIQDDFNRLIQNKTLVPLGLKTILHQSGPNQPIEEFLILDVAVSQELNNFRMSLLIGGYIRPDAEMQHQGRGFHITLGRRYIQGQSQQDLKQRLQEGDVVLKTVNWPGARL